MKNEEYVRSFIDAINEELDANILPDIKPTVVQRYPFYSNCIDRVFYLYDDLFDILNDDQKKLYIIYSYSVLLDADISTRYREQEQTETIRLVIDPNKLTRIICKLMGVEYQNFVQMQIDVYHLRRQQFPDDSNSSFYRIGDVLRDGIIQYKVIDVYFEAGEIMAKIQPLHHSGDNMTKIVTIPEEKMIRFYRIVSPAETQDE